MSFSFEMRKEEYEKANYRCNTMDMLEIFTKTEINRDIGVLPSIYVRELYMSPAERQMFLNMNNDCINLFANRSPNELIEKWDVKPRIILFTNWILGGEYENFFTVRNKYRTSKLVKLTLKESPVFDLEKLVNLNRLGSMVTFRYKVKFIPRVYIDYHDTIKLETENESLDIDIIAVAPRPLIDFPDKIDFGEVLVNFNNTKQIRLENISPVPAGTSLSTGGIFSFEPEKFLLNPNETMTLTIHLNYNKKTEVKDKLIVLYETGEKLYIDLCASCHSGNIYCEKKLVDLEEQYIGLTSTEELTLINGTDELLRYSWLNSRNLSVDKQEWDSLAFKFKGLSEMSRGQKGGMKYLNMIKDETHDKILDKVVNEELDSHYINLFSDLNFGIQPLEGEVNPKSKQVFIVTFKPSSVGNFRKKAYLEINGLEDRCKISLRGVGIGPNIVINISTIDFEQIFICSEHSYVITVKNIGLVKGTISYMDNRKLLFGETIKCIPASQEVLPGFLKHFELRVSSAHAGLFVEDVWFVIQESNKKIKCTLKGHIINPRLKLNKEIINFGDVSLGFKYTSSFTITNESPIPVHYKIEVSGDGIYAASQIKKSFELSLPDNPKEIEIHPYTDEILPSLTKVIEVSLVSNIARERSTKLKVYLWNVLVEECSLTLKYKSVNPEIRCEPNEILLLYAFIDYEYTREVTLYNDTDLPTCFSLEPQSDKKKSSPGMVYILDIYNGYLPPHSSEVIKIKIRVLSLTVAEDKIYLKVFGIPQPREFCKITAYGMGPVVNPSSFLISWESIPVLEKSEKTFSLINVSPICAFFKIQVVKYMDIWSVSKTEGAIKPESEVEIIVTAKLKDSGPIEDCLLVEIMGSREIYVSLSANGYGCSIVTEPKLFPVYDIGKVFRMEKHTDIIKVTNAGTRHHAIIFTTMPVIKNLTKAKAEQEQGRYFKLSPYKLDIEGEQTREMHLTYEWDKIEVLEDTYYCYAIIERHGKKVFLGSCTIRASFTDTELSFEPSRLDFRVDVPSLTMPILPQCRTLTVFSRWPWTLFLKCHVKKPFYFKDINKSTESLNSFSLTLEPNESQSFEVLFDPTYIVNRYSRVCSDQLMLTFAGHKVKAFVPVRGEVNFPNIEIKTHQVDFGCVCPNTEGSQEILLTNNSPLLIEFEWFWSQIKIVELKPPSTNASEVIPESNVENNFSFHDNTRVHLTPSQVAMYLKDINSSSTSFVSGPEETLEVTRPDSTVDIVNSESQNENKDLKNIVEIPEINKEYDKIKTDENNYKSINEFGISEIIDKIPTTVDVSLISQVINVIPAKSQLKPRETLLVTFIFSPFKMMKISGKALLKVIGGLEETISFKGCSYPVTYEIIPPNIYMGFGPFCELWCSSFFIWNKGLMDINVTINLPEYDSVTNCTDVISVLPERFGLSPMAAHISPMEVAYYKIALLPGRIGEIMKNFTLQINDLPLVLVRFEGYALPHQVHIALPRQIKPQSIMDMYHPIGTLTSKWFSFIKQSQDNTINLKQVKKMESEGWDMLLSENDGVPSTDDINMSYERYIGNLLAIQYTQNVPHSLSLLAQDVFSEFIVPPYSLDFGPIVTNTKAQCQIVYTNFCLMESIVKINFPPNFDELAYRYGVVLKPHFSTILAPLEKKRLAILLKPPHNALSPHTFEENINFNFEIRVSCGPVIPVNIKASIVQPFLSVPDYLDFGQVKVGYKRTLKCWPMNLGALDCEWFAFIRPLRRHGLNQRSFDKKLCPFTVRPVYGYTKSRTNVSLTIGFEPKQEDTFEMALQFIINMNPTSVVVRLKGCGLKPRITAKNVSFGCSLPYSPQLRQKLTIRNPCLFPLQVFIEEIDKDYLKEQDLFSYLLQYYRTDTICVPSTYYKHKPCNKMVIMFRRLVKKCIEQYRSDVEEYLKLLLQECSNVYEKMLNDEEMETISLLSTLSKSRRLRMYSTKSLRSVKKSYEKRKLSRMEINLFTKAVLDSNLLYKPLKEIINDYIRYVTLLDLEPVNLTLPEQIHDINEETQFKCGNIIFVYGSPNSDAGIFTQRVSKLYKMSVINLDMEIMIDLLDNSFKENRSILQAFENYYTLNIGDLKEIMSDDDDLFESFETIIRMVSDHFYMEQKKTELSKYRLKETKGARSKVAKSTRPKAHTGTQTLKVDTGTRLKESSDSRMAIDKTLESNVGANSVTLLNLPLKHLETIIIRRCYSKLKDGIIFEDLRSIFFKTPVSTLRLLLSIFKDCSNIKVISLCNVTEKNTTEDPNRLIAQGLEFRKLPPSLREDVMKEVSKIMNPSSKVEVSDILNKNKSMISTKSKVKLKKKKLSTKGALANKKRKGKRLGKINFNLDTNWIKGRYFDPSVDEYCKNLLMIYNLLEKYQRIKNEFSPSSHFMSRIIRKEEIKNEMFEKKAKFTVDDSSIPLWIFCSHFEYKDYQFEKYVSLLSSIDLDMSLSPKNTEEILTPEMELEMKYFNYYIIKPQLPPTNPELNNFKRECQLFKLSDTNLGVKKSTASSLLSLLSTSGSKGSELKLEMESEQFFERNIKECLKEMETLYLKEMDTGLKELLPKLKPGNLIKAGRSKKYNITFSPTGCSTYMHNFHIGITGCNAFDNITVSATCDIPDISFHPCTMFSDEVNLDEGDLAEIRTPGYLVKNKSYHFGTVLFGSNEDKMLFQVISTLKLKNHSAIDAKVTVGVSDEQLETEIDEEQDTGAESYMTDDNESTVPPFSTIIRSKKKHKASRKTSLFKKKKSKSLIPLKKSLRSTELSRPKSFFYQSPEIFIEAGKEKTFEISAYPSEKGLTSCNYIFSIENNPKVHILKAYSFGTEPQVNFSPNELSFDDVMVYRQVAQPLNMKNTCRLPLSWKIVNAVTLNKRVSLSRTGGILMPEEPEVVFVSYHPCEVQDFNEHVIIQIFDAEGRVKYPLLEYRYHLHLRSYDIQVEVHFDSSGSNVLDLCDVVALQKLTEGFTIKNKGRIGVYLKLKIDKNLSCIQNKQVSVILSNDFAFLKPQTSFQAKLFICPLAEVKAEALPVLNIEVMDVGDETIASIYLYLSFVSHFSRFMITPTHHLDFGTLLVEELKCMNLTIINTGVIEFKYQFLAETKLSDLETTMLSCQAEENRKIQIQKIFKNKSIITKQYNFNLLKNLSDLTFMKKFTGHQKLKYMKKKSKRTKYSKYILKNKKKRKLKFSWACSKLKNLKYLTNFQDLFCVKNIKKLWNLYYRHHKLDVKKDKLMIFEEKISEQLIKRQNRADYLTGIRKKLKLYVPPFRIVPAIGKIRAGEQVNVQVHYNPLCEGIFNETVTINVSNPLPDIKNGFPIHLSAESWLPRVNFEDYNSIFRELEIIEKWDDHIYHLNDGKHYEVFSIEENTIVFLNGVIGTTRLIRVYLKSENQVGASVMVTLITDDTDIDMCPFSLERQGGMVVHIQPYGCSSFIIQFSPKSMEECMASLLLSLEVPEWFKTKGGLTSFILKGSGTFPSIMLKEISHLDEENRWIDFGMILVGFDAKQFFHVENTSHVVAEVLLEIVFHQDVFTIHVPHKSFKCLPQESYDVCHGQTKLVLPPKENVTLECEFKPKKFITYSSRINFHILYNPFETLYIDLHGSGYVSNVIIEGLKIARGGELLSFGDDETVEYFLDFGSCIINRKYTQEFSLVNNCSNIIKYMLEGHHGLSFIPNLGHIFPGSKKKILSIIYKQNVEEPEYKEVVRCFYDEISYTQATCFEEWDNTHKSVKWTRIEGDLLTKETVSNAHMVKVVTLKEEPQYTIVNSNDEVSLTINVTATFGTPKLTVQPESLIFPPVTVSQSLKNEIIILNSSNCNAPFSVTICDETTKIPESVPDVTDFSFGKFDYNFSELLPGLESGAEFVSPVSLTTGKSSDDLWIHLRSKHLKILYGESVAIIYRKHSKKESSSRLSGKKSLNKPPTMKSSKHSKFEAAKQIIKGRSAVNKSNLKFKSGLSVRFNKLKPYEMGKSVTNIVKKKMKSVDKTLDSDKKNKVNPDAISTTSPLKKKSEARIAKSAILSIINTELTEIKYSDLVRVGSTYVLLPSDIGKPIPKHLPIREQDSKCFRVDISSGTIKPDEKVYCCVYFIPKHIHHYEAEMRIINGETEEVTVVKLEGLGVLPLCHIEIENNDYSIENPSIKIPHIPEGTKVIYIESMFKETFLKKNFKVFNITEVPYNFKWINLKNSFSLGKKINCVTAVGEIPPRGSKDMEFSFFPTDYDTYESLWLLQIREFNLKQPILFIYNIRKPMVSFESKNLTFEPTVKGFKRSRYVKLLNKEDIKFNYTINEDSLWSSDKNDKCLFISPMSGIIEPKSEEQLLIEFIPLYTSDFMFIIKAEVESTIHYLKLDIPPLKILSKCYIVEPIISCQKEDHFKMELHQSNKKSYNTIEIGKLPLRIPYKLKFYITNVSEVPLYFEAFLSEDYHQEQMSVEIIEKSGIVHPSNTHSFDVRLLTNQRIDFKELLIIKICKGPDFQSWLTGTAAEPIYQFNPTMFDFGVCIIEKGNYDKYCKVLEFSNLDTDPILLEKSEGKIEGFDVNFSSLTVEPRAVHKISIVFYPLSNQLYSGKINFLVNGIYKHEITLIGEGDTFKLELCNMANMIVNFGLVKARELVSTEVPIINKSKVAVDFSVLFPLKGNKDKFEVRLDPINKKMHLLPEEVGTVKVYFYGEERVQNCSGNVIFKGYGTSETLFVIKGTIIDYKFELDQKSILFDSATIGSPCTKKVCLVNCGDIGARFKIETRFTSEVFAIKPLEGYSPPSSKTLIEVSFFANFITKYCNNVLICLIENYEPLTLNLTGIGSNLPPTAEVIKFETNVRTKATEFVNLYNRTYEEQTLYPIVSGNYFYADSVVTIPAQSNAVCKIFYHPLTMTKKTFHLGHFFCNFTNGEVIFYQLIGQASLPRLRELHWRCKAKKKFIGKVPVQNWSTVTETYCVIMDSVKSTTSAFCKLIWPDEISVPPKKTRKCKIELICYKQCRLDLMLRVKNICSKEYTRFAVTITVTRPDITIVELSTPVRVPAKHKICLDNPMDKKTSFFFKSPHPAIRPLSKVLQVAPLSKSYLILKYFPIVPVESEEILVEINNNSVGKSVFKFKVKALAPVSEKLTSVETPFGTAKKFSILVENPHRHIVLFVFYTDSKDIISDQESFIVGPGKRMELELTYEPSTLGNNLMNVTLSTNGFGNYFYPIKGLSSRPIPHGPLIIKEEETFEFHFKNVLSTSENFSFTTNNNQFVVSRGKMYLKSKHTGTIYISVKKDVYNDVFNSIPPTGKLSIVCLEYIPHLQWDYYLKAE